MITCVRLCHMYGHDHLLHVLMSHVKSRRSVGPQFSTLPGKHVSLETLNYEASLLQQPSPLGQLRSFYRDAQALME